MGTSRLLVGGLLIAVLLTLNDAGLVKKILRHRRETLTSPGGANITLPNPHQPVVFNHVYNIKVPAGSLCSVDLDSPGSTDLEQKDAPDGSRITEHTLDGENQIVFTHRINIPKQACGCADGMPELKNLLSRLEMLEGEVSTLREQCTSGSGCCGAQATGTVGVTPYCSGRGNFSSDICGCICNPGWRGTNCSESDCPDNCSDQGRCVDGKCLCFEGYSGLNCSIEVCRVDCGKYGTCIDGVCVCIEYYGGEDCSESDCLNNCLGRGKCVDGDCVCEEPWTGFDCSELICPNDCYDRGRCNNGTCQCDPGFTGEDCGQQTCPNDCMGRGFCVDGKCVCSAGYTGEDCSSLTCLNDCSDRGHCFNGVCICDTGYQGEDCSQLACLNNCNDRGQCINGKCVCVAGFQGEDCSELSCPNNCRNRGRCVNGQCVCDEGFAGEDCNVKTCPSDCHGRGDCVDGKCVCHAGFTGEDCSELSCPNNCQNRGRCVSGQCVCDEGFTGEDCSLRACPNDCLGRGYCDDGRCICQEGFAGDDCSALTCPANCNNRGRCVNGMCQCETGFEGDDCGQRSCLNNCHGLGRCMDGQCVCDEGYIGEDCSLVSPAKDLTVTDVNTESVNLTWTNDMLVTEYLVTYVPTAPGGLQMERTVPGDRTAATIEDLEPGIEYLIKVFAVLSNKKSVPVSARVATHLPQPDGLKFKSIRETSVEVQWDQLDFPFDSWELSFRNTKEENGEIFNPLNRGQTSFEQFGLGPGQEYEVSLGVVKNNTKGPKVTQTVVTKLDTPGEMEIRDVSDTYAVIAWSPPVAQVDTVTLTFGPSSDPSDRKSVELSPTDTQHTADGLTPDTEYEVTLVAKRGDMTSDPAINTFTTDLDAPIDLQVVGQTDNTVTLEWTNTRSDVDNYRVKFSPVSGTAHGEELFPEGSGDKTTATITGLKPGTEYGIGVTAVKNERESLPATVHAVTDLDPPRDLEVKDSTETTLTLAWKRPRAKISNYRLAYESRTDGRWQEIEVPGDATTYTLTNLTPGTRHTVTLVAERGRKRSEPASTSASTASFTFYLAESGPELAAPTGPDDNIISFLPIDNYDTQVPGQEGPKDQTGTLTVSDVTSDGFNLSWEWKADVLYDSYTVELADAPGLWDNREIYLAGDAAGASVRGLNASTEYQVRLYGVLNSQRSSLPFEAVAVITAPKPTSPDVVALRLKFAPTSPQPAPETGVRPTTARTISTTPPSNTTETPGTMVPTTTKAPGTEAVPPEISATPSTKVSGTEAVPSETGVIPTTKVSRTEAMPSETRVTPTTKVSGTEAVPSETRVTPTTKVSGTEAVPAETRVTPTTKVSRTEAVPSETRVTPTASTMAPTKTETPGTESVPTEQIGTTDGASGDKAGQEGSGLSPLSDLNVTNVTQTSLSLTWSVPEPSEFDGFRITLVPWEQTEQLTQVKLVHSSARSAHIDGLLPGTLYEVSLYGMVEGEQSLPILVLANTTKEELKPQVGNLTVSDVSWDSFNVSWTVEEGEFEGFVIEVANMEGGPEHQNLTLSGDALSLFLSGLSPNSTYMVALYGLHKGLLLGPVYTEATTEAEPEIEHLFVSDITPESFRITWTVDEGLFDRFVIKVRDAKKLTHPQELNVAGDQRTQVFTQLMGGTEYEIELYGVTLEHRSQPVTGVARTGLGAPRGIRFSDITATSSNVHWTVPRADVDSYRVTFLPLQGGNPEIVMTDGTQSDTLLSSLIPGETYQVTVVAIKGLEESDPVTDTFTTGLDMPRSLTAVNITDTEALLLWQPAIATVDGYVITYSSDSVSPVMERVSGNIVEFEMSSLTPNTKYSVSVYATKDPLKSQAATTEFTTEMDAPRDLVASDVQTDSATLTWTPPLATVTGYILNLQTADGHEREVVLDAYENSYTATGLDSSTGYTARLQAIADDKRSSFVSTTFTTTGVLYTHPKDCSQALLNGESQSGLYTIYVGGDESQPMQVYCDMETDGGGWIVFLRRQSGKTEFFRNWRNYSNGFGDMMDEFWLGLSNLHKLTSSAQYALRVDLRDGSDSAYAYYDKITISEPRSRYKIQVGTYSGTAGDSMTYHQNRPFSTYDNDNDVAVTNCALSYKGAFWYKNCHRVNLMGRYGDNSHSKGINWFHWKGHEHSVPFAEMKIRPVNFGNLEGRRRRS
ncbi:tenascin isoform X2 [Engraulis encrasicolus]|uniref:tenascin isoform X2 n=1 Tax=Engraulis encrasicolus TaxID=184585 RepID=UPI002FD2555E